MSKIKRKEDGVVDIDHMLSNIDARIKAASANVVVGDADSIMNRNGDRKSAPSSDDVIIKNAEEPAKARKANPYINRDPVDMKSKVVRAVDSDDSEDDDDDGEEVLLVSGQVVLGWFGLTYCM